MVRKYKNRKIPRGIWLKDNTYVYVRIFLDKKRILKYIGPLSEPGILDVAIAKLDDYRRHIRLGTLELDEKIIRLLIEQACELFWEKHASQVKGARNYRRYLNLIKEFFTGRYLDTLTYVDVENYRRWRERAGVHPSTINREHTAITAMVNKLKEWNRCGVIKAVKLPLENPGSLVRKVDERPFTRKRLLSMEEFERLMKHAKMNVRRIVLAAINSTLRLKDLKALSRASIDEATNQINGVQAKTGKPYGVPINPVMRLLIDTAEGPKILDFANFRKEFEKACKDANIKGLQFRDLRRTGARAILKSGIDLATVKEYLGHGSIAMTERYVPPTNEDLQEAGEALSSKFGGEWLTQTEPEIAPKTENPLGSEIEKMVDK